MRIGPLLIKIVCVRKHFRISHQVTNLVVFLGRTFALYFQSRKFDRVGGLGAAGI